MLTLLAATALSGPLAAQDAALTFVQDAHFSLLDASRTCQALAPDAGSVRVMGRDLPLAGVFGLRLAQSGASANLRLAALVGSPGPYGLITRAGSVNDLDSTLARFTLSPAAFRVVGSAGRACLLVFLPQNVTDGPQRLTQPATPR